MARVISIRLSLEKADEIRQQLTGLGAVGQDVLRKLEQAGRMSGQAGRELGTFGRAAGTVERSLGGLNKALGAFGLSLSVGAIVAWGRSVIDQVGNLGELADQVGTTTEKLQVYQYIGGQVGLKDEKLLTVTAALARRLQDAADGADEAIQAFERLGVGVLDPVTKQMRSMDDVLTDVARATAGIDDPGQRAAAVIKLLGESGSRAIPFLRQLAEGFDVNADAARKAGLVIEDDLIRRFDQAADDWAKIWKRMVIASAEALDFIGKQFDALFSGDFSRWFAQAGEMAKRLGGLVGIGSGSLDLAGLPNPEAGLAAQSLGGVNPQGKTEAGREKSVADMLEKRVALLKAEAEARGQGAAAMEVYRLEAEVLAALDKTSVEQLPAKIQALLKEAEARIKNKIAIAEETAALQGLAGGMEDSIEQQAKAETKSRQLVTATHRSIAELEAQAKAAGLATVEWDELTRSYRVNDRELRIVQKTQELMRQDMQLTAEQARDLATAYVDAADALRKADEKQQAFLRRQEQERELWLEPFRNAIRGVQDLFVDMWQSVFDRGARDAEDWGRRIKTFFTGLAAQLAGLLTFRFALNATGLGGLLGMGGSAGGGGSSGVASNAAGSWLGNLIPNPISLASWANSGFSFATNPLAQLGGAVGGLFGAGASLAPSAATMALANTAVGAEFITGATALGAAPALSPLLATGIGAIIAIGAGLALSGILGGKKSVGPNAAAWLGYDNGQFTVGNRGADNNGDLAGAVSGTQAVADFLNRLQASYGIAPAGTTPAGSFAPYVVPAGTAGPGVGIGIGAAAGHLPGSPDAVIAAMLAGGYLTAESEVIRTVLANSQAADSAALEADLAFGKLYEQLTTVVDPATELTKAMEELSKSFDEAFAKAGELGLSQTKLREGMRDQFDLDVERSIRAITDPLGLALEDFERGAALRVETARKLGADLVKVEELTALEREAVLRQQYSGLKSLYEDVLFGPSSGLAPGASYEAIRAQLMAAAEAGDAAGIQGYGQSFIQASRAYYASGAGFQADRDYLLSILGPYVGANDNAVVGAITATGTEQARLLSQILAELGDMRLTGAAALARIAALESENARLRNAA